MKNNVLLTGQVVTKRVFGNAKDKTVFITMRVKAGKREEYPVVKIEGSPAWEAISEIRKNDWLAVSGKFTKYKKKDGTFVEEITCDKFLCHSIYVNPGAYKNEVRLEGIVKGIYSLTNGLTSICMETVTNAEKKKVISMNVDIYRDIEKIGLSIGDRLEVIGYVSTRKNKKNKNEQHIVMLCYDKTDFSDEELACSRVM